ncbi:MAG: rhodanese-like domain-containing protein, partial [Abditibacteriota bacterium]|nr:rhodanese-like domain-containing protein [Abditibacteriota bacterium]
MKHSVLSPRPALLFTLLLAAALLAGCAGGEAGKGSAMKKSYKQISQAEAAKMMARDGGCVILDVRTREEYDAGHIPGAVLLLGETIGRDKPALLPDTGQIILVYCRSGNRSKQAAQKLADMGYRNVYEFGGINTWKGEIVRE